ncbi:MAG: hypothetical protein NTU43_11240 [Bacteroidetes bacterium]|nr:hypothetical protein [Bacteroidota bacterium]
MKYLITIILVILLVIAGKAENDTCVSLITNKIDTLYICEDLDTSCVTISQKIDNLSIEKKHTTLKVVEEKHAKKITANTQDLIVA